MKNFVADLRPLVSMGWIVSLMAISLGSQRAAARTGLVTQGTDVVGMTPFGDNPAAYLPKETAVSIEVDQATNKHGVETTGSNPSTADFITFDNRTEFAYVIPSGPGFAFGLTGLIDNQTIESQFDGGGTTRTFMETFQRTEGGIRMIIGLTDKMRVGLNLNYQSLRANVVGSFFVNESDRTTYSGTLFGYGLGVVLGDKAASFGLIYAPPMKGKARVEGESKILADPGLSAIQMTFEISPQVRLGGNARKWMHRRDDRSKPYINATNQRQISLAGADNERDLLPDQELQIGVDFALAAGSWIRLSGTSRQSEFVFDEEDVPGDKSNADNRFTSYVATAALQVTGQKSDFQVGAASHQRQLDFRQGGSERKYKAKETTVFLSIAVGS